MPYVTAEEFSGNSWMPYNGIGHSKPVKKMDKWKPVGLKSFDTKPANPALSVSNWESLHTIIEETKSDVEVVPLKVSRLFAINFAMLTVCLFVAIIAVSGFTLLFLDTGVGGKAVGFTGLLGGLLSVAFIWYHVLYVGFKDY